MPITVRRIRLAAVTHQDSAIQYDENRSHLILTTTMDVTVGSIQLYRGAYSLPLLDYFTLQPYVYLYLTEEAAHGEYGLRNPAPTNYAVYVIEVNRSKDHKKVVIEEQPIRTRPGFWPFG